MRKELKSKKLQELPLIQGSKDWLEFRLNKITATDACAIMGVSPWKSAEQVLFEKTSPSEEKKPNEYMQRGLDLEDIARDLFIIKSDIYVYPAVIVSKTHPWMMSSMDGVSPCYNFAVEIKTPGKRDHTIALKGEVPEKYYPQLQHQMECCELDKIYYFSFDGFDGVIVVVGRNQKYIDFMIQEEDRFFERLQKMRAAI